MAAGEPSAMWSREQLIAEARSIASRAYAPYSHFRVGAVVVVEREGGSSLVPGVNIENASLGLTLCAERSALASARLSMMSGAEQVTQVAIACLDALAEAPVSARAPCGACRQWLAELAPQAVVYLDGVEESFRVADLLPHAFAFSLDEHSE
ncbi:MAG TPA: cytidine deaminase [Ktedonobacterales bacterium]